MHSNGKRSVRGEGGFTLVELLVILTIIGVLVAIGVSSYLGYIGRAADNAAKTNIRATLASAEAYYLDNGSYVGMTVSVLKTRYDAGIAPGLTIAGVPSVSSFCLTDTEARHTWSVLGPGATSAAFKNNATCS